MIKSRINLYTAEFRPVPERLSLRQLLGLLVFLLVMVVSALAYEVYQDSVVSRRESNAKMRLEQTQQSLEQAKESLKARQVDSKLEARVSLYQRDLKVKQLLMNRMDGRRYTNEGFSGVLTALASIEQSQVWLSDIQIRGGYVALKGSTRSSDDVPKWVSQFKYYPALADQRFSALRIYRDKKEALRFELSSSGVSAENAKPVIDPSKKAATGPKNKSLNETLSNSRVLSQAITESNHG
jgi:Tfp pilus assembly protein PilN